MFLLRISGKLVLVLQLLRRLNATLCSFLKIIKYVYIYMYKYTFQLLRGSSTSFFVGRIFVFVYLFSLFPSTWRGIDFFVVAHSAFRSGTPIFCGGCLQRRWFAFLIVWVVLLCTFSCFVVILISQSMRPDQFSTVASELWTPRPVCPVYSDIIRFNCWRCSNYDQHQIYILFIWECWNPPFFHKTLLNTEGPLFEPLLKNHRSPLRSSLQFL